MIAPLGMIAWETAAQTGTAIIGALTRASDQIEPLLPSDKLLVNFSFPAWLVCLGCLSPAVFRLMKARGRYLDPVWAIVFLLALNRLTFLFHVSAEVSHASAIMLAITMSVATTWYQRRDG